MCIDSLTHASCDCLDRRTDTPVTIYTWVGAATRYLLLKRGVISNTKISAAEEEVLQGRSGDQTGVRRAPPCDG